MLRRGRGSTVGRYLGEIMEEAVGVLLVGDRKGWDKDSGGIFKGNSSVSNLLISVHWWFHCMRLDVKKDEQIWCDG